MEMRKRILLRQMNKMFDSRDDIREIKAAFITFIASVIIGFLLTVLLSPTPQPISEDYFAEDEGYSNKIADKHRDQNSQISERLYRDVRVLCLVTTYKNHEGKAKWIKDTWGGRCNHIIFLSPTKLKSLETLVLPGAKPGRVNVWHSIREGLKHVHENFANKFDYVIKTDDNTYVVMENLRYLLETESPNEPKAYGFKYHKEEVTYLSTLQVLSRETVRRFVTKAYADELLCRTGEFWDSDIELGRCLKNIGVEFGDTLDSEGKERVFPFSPTHHMLPETMVPGKNHTYVANAVRRKDGLGALSDYTISFHSLYENSLVLFDYLVYHLRPYGIVFKYT